MVKFIGLISSYTHRLNVIIFVNFQKEQMKKELL